MIVFFVYDNNATTWVLKGSYTTAVDRNSKLNLGGLKYLIILAVKSFLLLYFLTLI